MLARLCDWAAYEFNLKQYYAYYAVFYALDGLVTSLVLVILWNYVPLTHFMLHALYKCVLDTTVHIGGTWLGLHTEALDDSRNIIYENMDTDTLGNMLVTIITSIDLLRTYFGYKIYMRGIREASEKV